MKKILVLFLALAVMFTGCSKANKTVLTIGDEEVSQYEFETYLEMIKADTEMQHGENIWETEVDVYEKTKERTVSTIIETKYALMKVEEDESKIENIDELVDSAYENTPEFLKYNKDNAIVDEKTHEEIVKKVIKDGMLVGNYMRELQVVEGMEELTYEEAKKYVESKDEEGQKQVEAALEGTIRDAKKGELTPVKGRTKAKFGDVANIDFKGTLDGVAFSGGTAKGHDLTLGSKDFIDGFEDQIVGKRVGTTFDIDVTFPENYGQAKLAGKAVVFEIKLNSLKSYEVKKVNEEEIKEEFYKYVYSVDKRNEKLDDYVEGLENWKKDLKIVKDEKYIDGLKYEKKEVKQKEVKQEEVKQEEVKQEEKVEENETEEAEEVTNKEA